MPKKPGGFQGFPTRKRTPAPRVNLPSPGAAKSPNANREKKASYKGPVGVEQWTPGQNRTSTRQPMIGGQTAPTVAAEIGTALVITKGPTQFRKGLGDYNPTERGMFGGAVRQYVSTKNSGAGPGVSYIKKVAGASPRSARVSDTPKRSATQKKITYGGRSRKSR